MYVFILDPDSTLTPTPYASLGCEGGDTPDSTMLKRGTGVMVELLMGPRNEEKPVATLTYIEILAETGTAGRRGT